MNVITPIKILGVPVHPYTMNGAVEKIVERVSQKQKTLVVTANAEIIMMGQSDTEYMEILNKAALVLPDGAGTVWAGRKLGYEVPERVAGYDLFLNLMAEAAQKNFNVFFFGAAPGVAEEAKQKCETLYPGISIVGCRNGYFKDADNHSIVEEINNSGADLLFVALGAPKQEKWLAKYEDTLKPSLLMGIGGSFDVVAGKMERAPKWMQDASLEWLFRLYKQPSRFRRMLVLPKFVIKVLRFKSYKAS
ncbi:MAG: WecB/TagA/CpsF family glycosyltransferase [Acholeplasmataceae bacterium]|nr:WecB/TagA/CpsF family glycosyltransferase [Acholeplasmataceae bacterium]